MSRITVVGGTGFAGSRIVAEAAARHEHAYRAALSGITLIPGSPVRNAKHLLQSLGADTSRRIRPDYFSPDLPETDRILEAICVLANQLDDEGSPIDQDRRRAIASSGAVDLLPVDTWRAIGKADGLDDKSHPFFRNYLFERITGSSTRGGTGEKPPTLTVTATSGR